MATDATETSSLTLDAPFTELHAQSGLPGTHTSRHTESGFLVDGTRLYGFKPTPPSKFEKRGWVWKHGEPITRVSDAKCFHLCRICYDKEDQSLITLTAPHTTQIKRHLRTHGYDTHGNKQEIVSRKRKRSNDDVAQTLKRIKDAESTVLNRSSWKGYYLAWVVGDDVSLRKASSQRFRDLVGYHNPTVAPVLPETHDTVRDWIIAGAQQSKLAVRRSLEKARSRITLSFDAWKSDNELDLLGIIAHYIDEQYQPKNVLLALRNTYGAHSGVNMKHHLLEVVREYKISNKVIFFMADNASPNDTALELLESELNINAAESRLRCTGHVINLVCKAILYGTDVHCVNEVIRHSESDDDTTLYDSSVSQFEKALRSKDDVDKLKAWRKKGPVGKLRNIVVHARATPKRRALFQQLQKEVNPDTARLYQLVVNGGIRWNSTYDMIKRALELREAIEQYQQAFKNDEDEPLIDDWLTNDDWLELKELLELLQPLKECSLFVQSADGELKHGALFEALTAVDYLLSELEELKEQHLFKENTHLKACINLGWKKLNKYYTLSDNTPAYRAAIILHPYWKMSWMKQQWRKHHPDWIESAKQATQEMFEEYKRLYSDEVNEVPKTRPQKELSKFERYNRIQDDDCEGDELERYLSEPRAPEGTNPITWWRLNQSRYPVLKHMAFDLLAAPASSAAAERQFSMAGHVLNEERFHTQEDLAEAFQCLKSAVQQGIHFKVSYAQ